MKLSTTLIFLVLVPIVVFAISYQIVLSNLLWEGILNSAENEAVSIAQIVSQDLQNPVYFLDVDEINQIITNLEDNPKINSVFVLRADGRIITDGTDENHLFDKILDDPLLQRSIQSDEIVLDRMDSKIRVCAPVIITQKIGMIRFDYSLAELHVLYNELIVYLTTISAVIAIVAGVIGYLISRTVSSPINQLKKSADKISRGSFDIQPDKTGPDEIKQLSEHLAQMASDLEKSNEALIRREKLSAIGELAARISHDLRNPLSVIKNAVEIISQRSQKTLDEKSKEYLIMINHHIDRINNQIEQILSFVKIKPLQIKKTSTKKLFDEAVKGVLVPKNILISLPQEDIEIYCDVQQMHVVLANLVTNSIQAIGEQGGKITLRAHEEKDIILIEIEDTGKGISSEDLERIFEPLYTTKSSGTGLGLVSCKNIVEQHGGKIEAKNSANHGAIIRITLPKKPL